MSYTKLDQPVQTPAGDVTTLNELLRGGKAKLTTGITPRGTHIFLVQLPNGDGWQVSEYAYKSAGARVAKETPQAKPHDPTHWDCDGAYIGPGTGFEVDTRHRRSRHRA